MSNIEVIIEKLYKHHKNSYISMYGADIVISTFIIYIFSIAIIYYYVLNHIPLLREKWPTEKCNPVLMPFAGMVLHGTKPNKTNMELIDDNFSGCVRNILESIVQDAFAPLYYAKQLASTVTDDASKAVDSIRSFIDNIRNDIANTASNISGRTLNVMMPPLHMTITMKDFLSKARGSYTAGLYTVFGSYYLMKSTLLNIIHIIIFMIVMALVASIAGLLFIPFVGWGLAAPLIAIFVAISIPLIPFIISIDNIFGEGISSVLPHW
tara:strand:- start:961 stop:1758 length:798 start_codon:yes stop_codon:yes gene_type:complete